MKVQLLELDGELKAFPNPNYAMIPEVEGVAGRERKKAVRELAYVFHVCDPTSVYANGYVDDYERREAVRKAIFKNEKWSPDKEVKILEAWYTEKIKTPMVLLLEGANLAALKIRNYFVDLDFTDLDERTGRPIHDVKKVSDTIRGLGLLVEGLRKLEDEVARDQALSANRRGIEIDEFSS